MPPDKIYAGGHRDVPAHPFAKARRIPAKSTFHRQSSGRAHNPFTTGFRLM